MTTSYGLGAAGFARKPAAAIKAAIETEILRLFGVSVDLDPRGDMGQIIGVAVGSLDDLWQLIELVNAAIDPDRASGQSLTSLAAITGTIRKVATPSTLTLILTGTATTIVPATSLVTNEAGDVSVSTDALATLVAASAWVGSTAYALDDVVTKSGHIYVAVAAGTSASSGGPTTSPAYPITITDGTVEWAFVGDGAASATVTATCTTSGAQAIPAFVAHKIQTPVTGWSGVGNPLDASIGRDDETDEELRVRRVLELHGLSTSPLEAILAALIALPDVTSATVFENVSSFTDPDGMPPHSVEAVVTGGTGDEIRATLFANVAAGIEIHGNTSGTVTDSRGGVHTVKYTVPTPLPIYVKLKLTVDMNVFPSDGVSRAFDAVLAFAVRELKVGYDVEPTAVIGSVFALGMRGLLRVDIQDDLIPISIFTPSQTIAVGPREVATFDSSRLIVISESKIP